MAEMTPLDHLMRNYLTYRGGYGSDNITSYTYTKERVDYTATQEVAFSVGGCCSLGLGGSVQAGPGAGCRPPELPATHALPLCRMPAPTPTPP